MRAWLQRLFGKRIARMAREERTVDHAEHERMEREIADQLAANARERDALGIRVEKSKGYYRALTEAMNRL